MTIQAAIIQKADKITNLNVARSLSGGVLPTSADIASWSSPVTSTNTVSLRTARTYSDSGIKIADLGRAVAVNGNFTLILGADGIQQESH